MQNCRDCQGSCMMQVCAMYQICSAWCGRRASAAFVSPLPETDYCIWAHQHSSWYSSLNKKKSAGLWRLPHFHKVHLKNNWEIDHGEGSQSLSSLWRWCLFLFGLPVMPVICPANQYIKLTWFTVACLVGWSEEKSVSLSLFLFDLMTHWSLRGALSKFNNNCWTSKNPFEFW
jgi:hypothetical protein